MKRYSRPQEFYYAEWVISIWQMLFDFYRDCGCDLTRMHNLIVDLKNIEQAFPFTPDKPVAFWFGCSKKWFRTEFVHPDDVVVRDVGVAPALLGRGCDYWIQVTVSPDGIEGEEVSLEETNDEQAK